MQSSARKIAKILLWSLGTVTVAGISGALGVLAVVYSLVYFGDDSNLKKSTILARINEETNIYMLDEKTQIGSIFADAHRRYVSIDEIPAHMINAIIAAEDKNFYDHKGVDPVALVSAGMGYLKGGRMRGASTLTQQTVRNILGWWEVSLSRKFREWIGALQIERLYSKRQILEFYLNQFYVSGNGNGIGIAAKYYFNKEVRDLDLVEAAFIAGSVKGPSAYDPFIKFTKERRERAINNAYHRKNYVIKRMYEQGWITQEQFKEAWDQPVKFNRGRFRTEEVSLVHLIRSQLERREILNALGIEDPRELSRAGLKIFSTIDPEIQKSAQISMRRNLSRLDTILKGFKPERPDNFHKLRSLIVDNFYYGQVTRIGGTEKEPTIELNFGLPNGTIPYESLMRYAKWLDLPWGRGWQKELANMMKEIKVGDVLYVEVKSYDPETHEAVLEMNKRPRVNGGLIVLDKGEARAVVSGFDTKGFNRAISAKRQPGSVFKSVVFFAALQLGWNIFDRVDNERQIFPFQGRFYYPRPDHDSPYKEASILWAGIMSENLASVALAAHLLDKVNFDQFRQLMGVMDLLPNPGESAPSYHFRVARATGVQLDNDGVREFQLANAVSDLALDMKFGGPAEFHQRLRKMWYGRGYAAEMQLISATDDSELPVRQRAERLKLAQNNFTRFQLLDQQLVSDWQTIQNAVESAGAEAAANDPKVREVLGRFQVLAGTGKPALGYGFRMESELPTKPFRSRAEIDRLTLAAGRPLTALDIGAIWGNSMFGSADVRLTDVLIDGWLSHANFSLLAQYLNKHFEDVMARADDFDLVRYWQHHDFRIALGLKYLVNMAQAMGVTSKIEPVLSFPLGTNDVSVAEVALLYQTFINGKTYKYYEEGPANQVNLVRRIEDRYGNVLFKPTRKEHQLVQPEFALQMREILRRVITHGTGRRAAGELYVTLDQEALKDQKGRNVKIGDGRVRIPAFGKTGTTNDYTNANFAGFVPYPTEKNAPLDPENSYVIATYAGYDLNKKMENGYIKVSGAQGALPAWIGVAKEIIDKKNYAEQLDTLDLTILAAREWPLKRDTRSSPIRADLPGGVVLDRGSAEADVIATTNISKDGESAFDEFRANVVQAPVRVPLSSDGMPLRQFAPFKVDKEDKNRERRGGTSGQTAPGGDAVGAAKAVDVSQSAEDAARRVYDEHGNRDGAQTTRASSNSPPKSVATAPGKKSRPLPLNAAEREGSEDEGEMPIDGEPSLSEGAKGQSETVDPASLYDELRNPDRAAESGSAGAGKEEENQGGFQEEELW